MQFSLFISCYYPDTGYPAERLYADMLEQAVLAEELGFSGLTVPEHHFINILMNPGPLLLALKIADATKRIPIRIAVLVLPFLDMKRLAGEIALTDCLTGGRLEIGVGRGAFAYEFKRFGVAVEDSRANFDESLAVLEALLSREEVSWDGDYYKFDTLTTMPRPLQRPRPPIWIAALAPPAIYHSALKGYHIMTTPLSASAETMREQVEAFAKAAGELEAKGSAVPGFSLLRAGFVARDAADARAKQRLAYGYFERFYNVRTLRGEVRGGAIEPIALDETVDEMAASLLVGTTDEVIAKLETYAALGIPEINLNMNIGASHRETMAAMERFAAEVMPHFAADRAA